MLVKNYTCDITEESSDHRKAVYAIFTEVQNGSTVFTLNERHSCNNPYHIGYLVLDEGSIVELIQAATKSDSKGKYPVDQWKIVGVKVRTIPE